MNIEHIVSLFEYSNVLESFRDLMAWLRDLFSKN